MLKEDSKATRNRRALAKRIDEFGTEMFPYSHCKHYSFKYVSSKRGSSLRCSECVYASMKCNVEGVSVSDWDVLACKEECLHTECNAAFQQMEEA